MKKNEDRRLHSSGPGPRSLELMAIHEKNVARGIASVLPAFISKAEGARVIDVDGREYIDFAGGIGTVNFGHNSPKVVEAIKKQADSYLHTCFTVAMYEPYVRLAESLNRITPGDFPKKTAFFNSGAEAVENAVKLSRRYTGKTAVLSLEGAFHGRTLLTMTLSSRIRPYKIGYGPFAPEVYRIPAAYCYRCRFGLSYPQCDLHCAGFLNQFLAVECAPTDVAALVAEPVQGEGGFVVPPPGYFERLGNICRDNEILLVIDEVQTGFYRTGQLFASSQYETEPDLLVMAKSLAGGLPLSAVTGKAAVMDSAGPGEIGGTYGGNPLSCAAALAVLETAASGEIEEKATSTGYALKERLEQLKEKYPLVGDHRGLGAMRALELVRDRKTKEPAPEETQRILKRCHDHGLIIIKGGIFNNVVRTLMPVNIEPDELNRGLDILEEAIAAEQKMTG